MSAAKARSRPSTSGGRAVDGRREHPWPRTRVATCTLLSILTSPCTAHTTQRISRDLSTFLPDTSTASAARRTRSLPKTTLDPNQTHHHKREPGPSTKRQPSPRYVATQHRRTDCAHTSSASAAQRTRSLPKTTLDPNQTRQREPGCLRPFDVASAVATHSLCGPRSTDGPMRVIFTF